MNKRLIGDLHAVNLFTEFLRKVGVCGEAMFERWGDKKESIWSYCDQEHGHDGQHNWEQVEHANA